MFKASFLLLPATVLLWVLPLRIFLCSLKLSLSMALFSKTFPLTTIWLGSSTFTVPTVIGMPSGPAQLSSCSRIILATQMLNENFSMSWYLILCVYFFSWSVRSSLSFSSSSRRKVGSVIPLKSSLKAWNYFCTCLSYSLSWSPKHVLSCSSCCHLKWVLSWNLDLKLNLPGA